MNFNEDFLHFIWKFKLFNQQGLKSTEGDRIEIISFGNHNHHSGPDFENVKIKINDTIWAGNAEIHLLSSDWEKHKHRSDKAYNTVVLHVVYQNDMVVFRNDGSPLPTLELKAHIFPGIELNYQGLMQNLLWIPCEKRLAEVDSIYVDNWLSRVLIERLEEKSQAVFSLLEEFKGSWDDVFYLLLARGFGFKTNSFPFELLARSLPQQLLAKHKNNALQIEALIFGQAGFLTAPGETYHKKLQVEFSFLKAKYQLKPIDEHLWKFLRLRPQNFPTIRLAQFAALVVKSNHLFSKLLEIDQPKELAQLFKRLTVNHYWKTHYRFGKEAENVAVNLGSEAVNSLLLNAVAVIVFSYGKHTGNQVLLDRAVHLLETLPAETNHITKRFKGAGLDTGNAARSQAMIQLKKNYCDQKKCLNCAVGAKIIKLNHYDTANT